jgi:lipoprotein-anchoring transpeptidase ErfK/SrfK
MRAISRRGFILAAPVFLGGCVTQGARLAAPSRRLVDPAYAAMYGARPDERFPIPAIDVSEIDPALFRQEVRYRTQEQPGTLVVEPHARFLYLVREGGMALRYGAGVGRAGYDYQGAAVIGRKVAWPRWTPTPNMLREDPEKNGPWAKGMEPGLENPLGARALYLYEGGRDTLYRIHGTNDPDSIGRSVSSGCIRLFNQDVIDLFNRVPVGTRVVVRGGRSQEMS